LGEEQFFLSVECELLDDNLIWHHLGGREFTIVCCEELLITEWA